MLGAIIGGIKAGLDIYSGIKKGRAAKNAGNLLGAAADASADEIERITNRDIGNLRGTTNAAAGRLDEGYSTAARQFDPYAEIGRKSITQLSDFLGDPGAFKLPTAEEVAQSPAVQFRLKMGQEALDKSAAMKGTALSGGQIQGLNEFAQELASTEYDKQAARLRDLRNDRLGLLTDLAGRGQSAAGSQAGLNVGSARDAANLYTDMEQYIANLSGQGARTGADYRTSGASARAAGMVGQADQFGQVFNNVGNDIMDLYGYQKYLRNSPYGSIRTPPFVPQDNWDTYGGIPPTGSRGLNSIHGYDPTMGRG